MPTTHPPEESSRRSKLSERRLRAIDAHIELVLEGNIPPTIEQVAERSRVSVPTLFRYFENLDKLRADSARRAMELFSDSFRIPDIGVGPRDERIRRFAASRVKLWERTHFLARLVRHNALRDPGAAKLLASSRKFMANQVKLHFKPELQKLKLAQGEDAVALITSVTSVESWDQFRHGFDRTAAETQRAWTHAIGRILAEHR